jgi:hypothetical protein
VPRVNDASNDERRLSRQEPMAAKSRVHDLAPVGAKPARANWRRREPL